MMKPGSLWVFRGVCLLMGWLVTTASGAGASTLEEALISAYHSNPTLLEQREALRAEDEMMPQALSGWLPSLEFDSSLGRRRSERSTALGFFGSQNEMTTPRTFRLTFRQPVYQGGRTLATTDQAKNTILAARSQLVAIEQDILLRAATAFLNVVRDQALLELSRHQKRVLARRMQATEDQFEVGEATRADLYQARARHAGAVADAIQSEGNLNSSQATYLKVTGSEAGQLPTLENLQILENFANIPESLDEILGLIERDNPQIAAALYQEMAAQSRIDEVRSRLLPQVGVRARANYDYETSVRDGRTHSLEVVADFHLPIYQSGLVMSQLRQSKYRRAETQRMTETVRRDHLTNANIAWQEWIAAQARIRALEEEIAANMIALEGVRQEALVGTRTVLDILNAEQALYDSRTSLVQAKRNAWVARFQIQAAIGRFTASQLNLDTEIYDPIQHYEEVKFKFWGFDIEQDDQK